MSSKKILLVDDDLDFSSAISTILSSNGYDVMIANSGIEGYEMAQNFMPDLFILDVNMETKSAGFELNKNYIATKLCENRNRPWMHCNGKCYLMKKIRQAEEKQNNAERESQKNLIQESYFETVSQVKFYTRLLQVIAIPNERIELPQGFNAIFRPPQLG